MKINLIQPGYSFDYDKSDIYFEKEMELLKSCDSSADIIVLPENCDVPCLTKTKEEYFKSVEKYNKPLLEEAAKTAKRCGAVVFINAIYESETGKRNTTYMFGKNGEIAGKYFKQHLVPSEMYRLNLDRQYTYEFSEPVIIEYEGIRYGFLTCYDFYFYEALPNIARMKPDIIIGCSHQRSDTHDALETMSEFIAYNTNTYLIRSSVSLGENSPEGGSSLVVSPEGKLLLNMVNRTGVESVDIDISKKYYKPAGFGNPPAPHYEYVDAGRKPWKYRPAGSAIVPADADMPYPRICAHRGFNTIAPENSLPAFGAAIAMGAQEIEFDLWQTKDGEIVSIHDATLERVSDGEGLVYEKTYDELLKFDFGAKCGKQFSGMKILKFEDILKKFSCHAIMNIHIKTKTDECEYDRDILQKIIDLIDKYDCRKHVYFMSGNLNVLKLARELAPDICRVCGAGSDPWAIVNNAIEYGCKKVQLFKPYFNREMIDKAHANGIYCNVFWSDDKEEAKKFLDMGIDTILTNDYNRISQVL